MAGSIALLTPGCRTAAPGSGEYLRDGVAYGVTENRFRGRWWNYYERGRSFHAGGFFEEAEADLRLALKSRGKDAFWPRTYGMHFLPEYFPHRELGINLYFQERLEDAISELETSLAQQYSARASFYIDRARGDLLRQTGADTEPPSVTVEETGKALSGTRYTVRGTAMDDQYVSAIAINGESLYLPASAPSIAFEHEIALEPGENAIAITVTDLLGKETDSIIRFANDVDGPIVSFDPEGAGTTLSGVVYDPSGVRGLWINEEPVALHPDGDGLMRFGQPQPYSGLLAFRCEDDLGNITFGDVPGAAPEQARATAPLQFAARMTLAELGQTITSSAEGVWRNAAALADSPPVTAALDNIEEGRAFYQDEIVLALKVESVDPIREVRLLDTPIEIIPARNSVHMTRRVSLDMGVNEITLAAVDVQGNRGEDVRTVQRDENALEYQDSKLAIAFLPAETGSDADMSTVIAESIQNLVYPEFTDRFNLKARGSALDSLLLEQELSTLLARQGDQLVAEAFAPFEVLFTVRARVDQDSLEISLDAHSSELGFRIAHHIDVAGPADQSDALIHDLATRIMQEFPRAQGEVFRWRSPTVDCTLREQQGVKVNRKCLVYRMIETEYSGRVYRDPELLGQGFLTNVRADSSAAKIVATAQDAYGSVSDLPIEQGYFVVLK